MADDLHNVIYYGVRLYFKLLYLEKGTRQFGQYSVFKKQYMYWYISTRVLPIDDGILDFTSLIYSLI